MPEQIKRFVSVEDLKLLAVIISAVITGMIAWTGMKQEVADIRAREEIRAEQVKEQVVAVKELTKAVQNLNITTVQLEERLKGLERVLPEFKNSK